MIGNARSHCGRHAQRRVDAAKGDEKVDVQILVTVRLREADAVAITFAFDQYHAPEFPACDVQKIGVRPIRNRAVSP